MDDIFDSVFDKYDGFNDIPASKPDYIVFNSTSPIKCEHPILILHPSAKYHLLKTRVYFISGKRYYINDARYSELCISFDYKYFNYLKQYVNVNDLSDTFVIDESSGEVWPLYMLVPCGKCLFCREKKALEWSSRVQLESQCYDTWPLFVTLTYDNEHLPAAGVNKRDVQLFFKRLRKFFEGTDVSFRYLLVAEYGKNTHRPHYHAILFGFPPLKYDYLSQCIDDAWSLGFTLTKYLQDSGGARYVTKYMRKRCIVPKGLNDVFFLSSRGNARSKFKGGIGAPYIQQNIEWFRANPQCTTIDFQDKFSGKLVSLPLCGYIKSKVFPTESLILPLDLRMKFQTALYALHMLYWLPDDGTIVDKDDVLDSYQTLVTSFPYLPSYDIFDCPPPSHDAFFGHFRDGLLVDKYQERLLDLDPNTDCFYFKNRIHDYAIELYCLLDDCTYTLFKYYQKDFNLLYFNKIKSINDGSFVLNKFKFYLGFEKSILLSNIASSECREVF